MTILILGVVLLIVGILLSSIVKSLKKASKKYGRRYLYYSVGAGALGLAGIGLGTVYSLIALLGFIIN